MLRNSSTDICHSFSYQSALSSGRPAAISSPGFRKEKGAHGIEERGIYRIHQFEKQEMIVVCRPEESAACVEETWMFRVWAR